MVDTVTIIRSVLALLRLAVFALSLGITIISFQAYRKRKIKRLQYAFLGFAFVSMGVAVSSLITQLGVDAPESVRLFFEIAEAVPFVVGFSMLYLSLNQ